MSDEKDGALRGAFVEGYDEGYRQALRDLGRPRDYVPVTDNVVRSRAVWHERWGQHFNRKDSPR